jgi:ABC-type lipoprotein release transport system permease subunit
MSQNLIVILGVFAGLIVLLLAVGKVPLRYNLRNLMVRWKTTLVTALAFTAVVALLVVMLAFVTGMYKLTEQTGNPANVLILSDGATDEIMSSIPSDDTVDTLGEDIKKNLATDAGGRYLVSREVFVVANQPLEGSPGGRQRRYVQMRGIEDADLARQVHDIQLYPGGRWFENSGFRSRPRPDGKPGRETLYEVVVGEAIAREFAADKGKEVLEPGDVLTIGPVNWVVIGIMKTAGSTFGSELWALAPRVQELFNKNTYTSITGRTRDPALAQVAAELLKKNKSLAVTAQPEKEYYAKLTETNKQFLFAAIFVGAVMALGGLLGVMNTMFAAISQRTKDIGVLRILGYTRRQVLVSFLLESLVIGLLGGLLGCALGFLVDGRSAASTLSSGMGGGKSVVLQMVVDADTVGLGLVFTLFMATLGGLVPALSAMRLRPLESMR